MRPRRTISGGTRPLQSARARLVSSLLHSDGGDRECYLLGEILALTMSPLTCAGFKRGPIRRARNARTFIARLMGNRACVLMPIESSYHGSVAPEQRVATDSLAADSGEKAPHLPNGRDSERLQT